MAFAINPEGVQAILDWTPPQTVQASQKFSRTRQLLPTFRRKFLQDC